MAAGQHQIAEWRQYRRDSVRRATIARSRGDLAVAERFDKLTVQWDALLARNGIQPEDD